jgi:hypothetical protein
MEVKAIMRQYSVKVAALAVLMLSFAFSRATSQQPQNPPPPDQGQQQQAEPPPHVDAEPNPEARQLEKSIQDALAQDPHMAYSRVRVQATDSGIILSGTVLTATAKDQAEQIATQHAGGKKITNRIRVNPNVHPGPGF